MTAPDTTAENFDPAAAEVFAERMLATLNAGALATMISIGHRTRLFDTLAQMDPATSEQIAARAGLDERYVREWLGAMVTGGVVAVDADADAPVYRLPAEHAASLTRAASPANMAATFQWLPLLGSVEDEVVTCFEQGGGVPYSAYRRFHEVMAEESGQTVVAVLLEQILPAVPGVVEALERGIDVLDVGCGSGQALQRMAERFPKSRFTGYDFSEEAVGAARNEAAGRGLGNLRFQARDAAGIEEAERFDLITAFDAIHDQARPAEVLAGIARALRPDGLFLMQDISGSSHVHRDVDHPLGPFLYTVSCMHCMSVSLAEGGAGLGAMWGSAKACAMLAEAGFGQVEIQSLPHDAINFYYTARK